MADDTHNLVFDALLGSFTPTRLDMRLLGKSQHFYPDTATPESLATVVHETFHFYQTIFSGYGHISWDSTRQLTSHVKTTWEAFPLSKQGKKHLPLAHYKTTPAIEKEAFTLYLTAVEQLLINSARYFRPDPFNTLADMGSKLFKEPWQVNPKVNVNGKTCYLQGKDIIEGHAYYIERSFLEGILQVAPNDAWDRAGIKEVYTNAYDWFLSQCGQSKVSAFPIVCDLAIQTSYVPSLPKTEADWRAASPAWRFVELTGKVVQLSESDPLFSSNLKSNYKKVCNALLKSCNYMDLDSICNERLSALKRKPKQLEIEKLMYDAMLYKKRNPWCLVNPVASITVWEGLKNKFNPPLVVLESGMGSFGSKQQVSGMEIVAELQYQAFVAQILGDFSANSKRDNYIECAFAKYKIPNGCKFQTSHSCTGRYETDNGAPHAVIQLMNGEIDGCSLEMLINRMGLTSRHIEINAAAKFNLSF